MRDEELERKAQGICEQVRNMGISPSPVFVEAIESALVEERYCFPPGTEGPEDPGWSWRDEAGMFKDKWAEEANARESADKALLKIRNEQGRLLHRVEQQMEALLDRPDIPMGVFNQVVDAIRELGHGDKAGDLDEGEAPQ